MASPGEHDALLQAHRGCLNENGWLAGMRWNAGRIQGESVENSLGNWHRLQLQW